MWCFDRFGTSKTALEDGRTVHIGGEHEDFYDPDFHIYNDVIVVSSSGQVAIYGYPLEAFPPIDFHSATLVGKTIDNSRNLKNLHPHRRKIEIK